MSTVERRRDEADWGARRPDRRGPGRFSDDATLVAAWPDLVAKNPGRWVAVRDGRVVAVADDQLRLFDRLEELGVPVAGTLVEKLSARAHVGGARAGIA